MRYDSRSSRGRRSGGRRPASRQRQERYDRYEDEEEEYYPPPRQTNFTPWIVVSLLVVLVVAIVIVVGTMDSGEDQTDGPIEVSNLSYGSFAGTQYVVKVKREGMKTQWPGTVKTPFAELIHGTMQVSVGGGGGSASLEVTRFRGGLPTQDLASTDCPSHGATLSFQLGPQGGVRTTDTTPETHVLRTLVVALFPDLPSGTIRPTGGDSWTASTSDALFSVVPWPGEATMDYPDFVSRFTMSRPSDYEGKTCVRISTETPIELKLNARAEYQGEEVPARYTISSSGYSVVEVSTGMPCEARFDFKGYMFLKPDGTGSFKNRFTYDAFLKRVD